MVVLLVLGLGWEPSFGRERAPNLILVLADIGVRILPTVNELKLGVVAALIGAPAFIWIAMGRRAIHD